MEDNNNNNEDKPVVVKRKVGRPRKNPTLATFDPIADLPDDVKARYSMLGKHSKKRVTRGYSFETEREELIDITTKGLAYERDKQTGKLKPIKVSPEFRVHLSNLRKRNNITGFRESKYKPWMCDKVVEIAADGGYIAKICIELSITPPTLTLWEKTRPEFARAMGVARLYMKAYLEEKMIDGMNGEIAGFNSTALAVALNAKFPEEYKRANGGSSTEITVNNNTVNMSVSEMDDKIKQIHQKFKSWGIEVGESGGVQKAITVNQSTKHDYEDDSWGDSDDGVLDAS